MPPPLLDRIALVTGASRGIGYATALALAKAGAHVVALARTVGGLEELDDAIKSFGATATLVPLDLKDYAGIDRLGLALHERFGRLDVLVGNAGILGPLSPLDHVETRAWEEVMAVNVTANWRLIRAMDRLLKLSDAGRVVFVSSGPIRTRMRAQAFPGEDPMTLEPPENPAEKIVDMCLSSTQETGRLYAYPKGKFLDFRPPA